MQEELSWIGYKKVQRFFIFNKQKSTMMK